MKITYGKERKGRICFDTEHKYAPHTHESDKCTMVMKAIIRKYEDAGDFKLFINHGEGGNVCGHFNVIEA